MQCILRTRQTCQQRRLGSIRGFLSKSKLFLIFFASHIFLLDDIKIADEASGQLGLAADNCQHFSLMRSDHLV